jgi:hypothetical protein
MSASSRSLATAKRSSAASLTWEAVAEADNVLISKIIRLEAARDDIEGYWLRAVLLSYVRCACTIRGLLIRLPTLARFVEPSTHLDDRALVTTIVLVYGWCSARLDSTLMVLSGGRPSGPRGPEERTRTVLRDISPPDSTGEFHTWGPLESELLVIDDALAMMAKMSNRIEALVLKR